MIKESEIRKWFFSAIDRNQNASTELKLSLKKRHQMVDTYIKTLYREFIKTDAHFRAQNKKLKPGTYKWFTEEMANNFTVEIEKTATTRIQSDLERLRIKKEQDDKKDLEKTFEGTPSGDIGGYVEEGSLIIDEAQLAR